MLNLTDRPSTAPAARLWAISRRTRKERTIIGRAEKTDPATIGPERIDIVGDRVMIRFLIAREARAIPDEEVIVLVDYRAIQRLAAHRTVADGAEGG